MLNVSTPSSAFVCGSQDSGKSYTLACMLENCLLKGNSWGELSEPLPGLVFHYDVDRGSSFAEMASLYTRRINVKVLVSRTKYCSAKPLYGQMAARCKGQIEVTPLILQDNQ
jgi:hypothetical protein